MRASDLVPPLLSRLIRRCGRLMRLGDREAIRFRDYGSALAECGRGYEDDALVEVICTKTERYRDRLRSRGPVASAPEPLHVMIGLGLMRLPGDDLNVLDFGGGCGAHYFLVDALIGDRTELHWHVIETPKLAVRAREFEDGRLRFYADLETAREEMDRVDLVFSSGALQYVPRPYETLENLTKCRGSNLLLTRIPLTTSTKELILVQESKLSDNGPGPMPSGISDRLVTYPVTVARKEKFEAILNRDYSTRLIWRDNARVCPARECCVGSFGYFADLKTDRQ